MSMLLDTNVLLRLVTDNPHIGESFKQAVETGLDNGDVAVSAVTFMETTRLHHHRRIDLGCHPATWRRERLMSGLLEIPIDGDLAVESVLLDEFGVSSRPRGPTDRRHSHADRNGTGDFRLCNPRLGITDPPDRAPRPRRIVRRALPPSTKLRVDSVDSQAVLRTVLCRLP